jgi:hypothetical protein
MDRYSSKHIDSGAVVDEAIRRAFLNRGIKDSLPCAVAFEICEQLKVVPLQVGKTADLMDIRLVKCQLGLFGYAPKKSIVKPLAVIKPDLKAAIMAGLRDDRLPCREAWRISDLLGYHKLQVAGACDGLGIKIAPCQLGAF